MPLPLAAMVAARARRRVGVATVATAVAGVWLVVMAVVVVAIGGTPSTAELAGAARLSPVALDAYRRAADSAEGRACGMGWPVLAAVGQVESGHAAGHAVAEEDDPTAEVRKGDVSPPVLGRVLDGTGGTARVPDSDDGTLDGDARIDRAVGPLQFLPSSWTALGRDGDADGEADPQNFYDAAAGATAHLCAAGPLDDDESLARALRRYNDSDAYVTEVLGWVRRYEGIAREGPSAAVAPVGAPVDVRGIRVDAALAPALEALLAAAESDGLVLGGSGWRSHEDQIALRRAHCGASDWALYEMAASACSPPTARPGESLHESGLAVDFTCAGALVDGASPCFEWLATHAATFGLSNLASEPWHWSTTGG